MSQPQADDRPLPANPALLGNSMLRNLGNVLDDFARQGLIIWSDDQDLWHWRWRGTKLRSQDRLVGMGEAIVDAVATRFPTYFEYPPMLDRAYE